jgi:YD repeat-containing protein
VDRRQLLFGMSVLALGRPALNDLLGAQTSEVAKQLSSGDSSRISDREQAGLRGPVRTVSEDTTRTEYDPTGRLISNRWLANPGSESSESIETRSYDGSGRLLRNTVRNGGGVVRETIYSYDDHGRLLRMVDRNGDRTSFQYDAQGHKISVRDVAQKSHDREGVAVGLDGMLADVDGNPEFGLDRTGNASKIKTVYDEHDNPTETQAFDADGHLLGRTIRTYNEKHRITDVRVIIDDPTSQFSAKQMADMAAQSSVPLDEIKAELKKASGAMRDEQTISYTYDSHSRRTKIILHQGPIGVSKTYSYNDHGDVGEERTVFTQDSRIPIGVPFHVDETGNLVTEKPPFEWPPQLELPESVIRYTYTYDSFGNWTELKMTRSEGPECPRHRKLTYY